MESTVVYEEEKKTTKKVEDLKGKDVVYRKSNVEVFRDVKVKKTTYEVIDKRKIKL